MLATHEAIAFQEPRPINGLVPNAYLSNYASYFLLFHIMSQPPWSQIVNIKMFDIYDLMLAAKTNLGISYASFGATHNTS